MLCYLTHLDQKEKKKRSKVGLIYLNVCSMLNSQKYTPIFPYLNTKITRKNDFSTFLDMESWKVAHGHHLSPIRQSYLVHAKSICITILINITERIQGN